MTDTKHECPYGGASSFHLREGAVSVGRLCGEHGWLCDRCKEDRADKRNERLIASIALHANWKSLGDEKK